MKKLLAALGALLLVGGLASPAFSTEDPVVETQTQTKIHKSYVCKYITTPGDGEVLQTGQNPIWVDNSSLSGKDEEVNVGDSFSDAQGRSVVIVANTPKLDPEPGLGDCEGTPPTPVLFSFSDPVPPTCEEAGSFLQAAFPGVSITVDPAYSGPGTYTVTATLDEPLTTTWPDGTTEPKSREVTVQGKTGFQSTDPQAACYLAPTPTPTPTTPTPTPTVTTATPTPTVTTPTPTVTQPAVVVVVTTPPAKTTPPAPKSSTPSETPSDTPVPTTTTTELPKTGGNTTLALVAAALLAGGATLIAASRRRRGAHQ
jgi:LPXTG-motif cell wall-anchored protein